MLKLLTASALVSAAVGAPSRAAEVAVDERTSTVDAQDGRKQQLNIWFCAAVRRGYQGYDTRFYFGASRPFGAGSGEGQTARYYAFQSALSNCGGAYRCVADCYVQRFDL